MEERTHLHIALRLGRLGREGETSDLASCSHDRPNRQPIPPFDLSVCLLHRLVLLNFLDLLPLALAVFLLLLLPLPTPPPRHLLPQLLLRPKPKDVDRFLAGMHCQNWKSRVKGDLGDVVGVRSRGEGEGGDRSDRSSKLSVRLGDDALRKDLAVDLPALDFALSSAADEDSAVPIVRKRPCLPAMSDDRLDAMLGRKAEQLDERVLGRGEEVGSRRLGLARRRRLVVLSLPLRRDERQPRDLVPMPPQSEHSYLSHNVPDDDIGVLGARREPRSVRVPGECADGALVPVESDGDLLGGGRPDTDGTVGVADCEGVPIDGRTS